MGTEIRVVGAVIGRADTVLCALRGGDGPIAGFWEFPGGKVEPGESEPEALRREIEEELDCEVSVGDPITTTRLPVPAGTLVLTTYHCTIVAGEPRPLEHRELRWLRPSELRTLTWAPADIEAVHIIAGTTPRENP